MPARTSRTWEYVRLAGEVARGRATQALGFSKPVPGVAARLGKLGGLPQKLGQLLSLGELDAGPGALTALTETAPLLSPAEARELIQGQLGGPLQLAFRVVDELGVAATFAQVHRAELLDGRKVALKLQLPGCRERLAADLRGLGFVAAPLGGFRRGLSLDAWRMEIERELTAELDYSREADMLRRLSPLFRGDPVLEVPTLHPELCTKQLLVMSWLDGESFPVTRTWPASARGIAGTALLRFFLQNVLRHRLAHADPHSGNLRFRLSAAGPRIGVLDLGAVQELPGTVVDGLHRLIHAAVLGGGRESAADLVERFTELGFQRELLWPMRSVLPEVVQALTLPFRSIGPFAAESWRLGERLEAALGEHRWNFRAAGSPALLPVIRALSGTAQYLAALRVPVDWRDGYTALALPAPAPGAPGKQEAAEQQAGGSKALRVRVREHGQVKVLLSFPADAAGRLDELLPDDVRERLEARGIGAGVLGQRAADGGLAPGCLFELSEQGREMRVWLE